MSMSSTTATPPAQQQQSQQPQQPGASTPSSAWSRGPPSAAASKPSSAIHTPTNPSGSPQPQSEAGKPETNGNGNGTGNGVNANGNGIAIAGHSRKGSIMVGGGQDIKRGSIAFGTVDSPNNLLSSSPAAPSMTGTHLSDTVKQFGSIEADASNNADALKANRRASGVTSPSNPPKIDAHSLFQGRKPNGTSPSPGHPQQSLPQQHQPQQQQQQPGQPPIPHHDRRQSMSGYNGPNGIPPNPQQSHLRPPQHAGMAGQSRSPMQQGQPAGSHFMPGQPQIQQGFRPNPQHPQHPNAQAYRPGQVPQMHPNMQRPMGMGGYGMYPGQQQPYPMMGHPNQYYEGYGYPNPQFGGVNQWAPQQHPQNQQFNAMPISPRPNPAQLQPTPSPGPPNAQLPHSGGASPAPTPPSRPPSLISHHPTPSNASISSIPSTPSRPMMPSSSSSFTPPIQAQSPYGLSGSAASFTPRASKAIKIARPDGTAVDMKQVAAAAKGPATPGASEATTPDAKEEPPKKKMPSLPVVVRVETEAARQARLKEEAERAKIRDIEAKEEEERKERKARREREEQEKAEKEQKDKELKETERKEQEERDAAEKERKEREAAEEKKKMEEELAAEQAAAKKAQEAKDAAAKAEQDAAEKAKAEQAAQAAKEAREKAEEKNRALMTPVPSTPASPLASPALAAAGLPPKPVVTTATPPAPLRRAPPSSLEISTPTPDSPATASAMSTARPIEDLKSIVYPGSTKSPKPELNVDAEPGKFRYDRDFLMQFMTVCREKPDDLPPLEEIGLEAETSSGFGSRGGGRGGRASMGGKGAAPIGLGIGGPGSRPGFGQGQGMGTFRMDQFPSSGRGLTSEERYNRSLGQNRQNGMTRTPSQGGIHGLPTMSMSTSRSGTNRSRGGAKRQPAQQLDPDVAPLVTTASSWVKSRPGADDEGSPAHTERKVKSLLNKLTAEKFDSIAKQILEWANKSINETDGITLKLVIKQIFEKATDEAHWSSMYAKLCRMLLFQLDQGITEEIDGKPVSGGMLFRKYLVGRCQADFEAGWKAREDAATAAAAKSEEDRLAQAEQEKAGEGETVMLSDEYYAAQKAKRRGLGLVQLIGELYKLDMIGKGVIRTCFAKLLGNVENPDEEDLESTCKLLTTVGAQYDVASKENMDIVYDRLEIVLNTPDLASRIRFMIMDVKDLRAAKWASKKTQTSVMTIAEVHQQAAREQAEKSAAAAQSSRESISRGGSRTGSRRDAAQPGEWQSVAPAARQTLPRPADFSQLGRNISSTPNAGPNFGPKSVFSSRGGKSRAPGATTPPTLSRQASTSNMFSALHDMPEGSAAAQSQTNEPEPQRKKLALKPRTKPLPGEGEEGEEGEEEGEEEQEEQEDQEGESTSAPAMGTEGAKAKIDRDMKELWGEKGVAGSRNPDDIVEYYGALLEEHRGLLSERLLDDVFKSSKVKDFEIVCAAWSKALADGSVAKEKLLEGVTPRMPTLDDDSIDFPQAYKAIALVFRSLSLSTEEMDGLLEKIDVYGEPRITPKMKFDKAMASLDE